ncbi:MAG: iron ABC transporter permease [Spirochaetota bacterium]|nr:iron ABC transporter permease [Spirochaetota bacterium]
MSKQKGTTGTKYKFLFFSLSILLFIVFIFNIGIGSVNIPFVETTKIIFQHITDSTNGSIIWKIRMPRAIASLLSGGYLAVAGLLLQVFFRNPVVGPSVLGISFGAVLTVGIVMLAGLSFGIMSIHPLFISFTAFLGSLSVMFILLAIISKIKDIATLLIIGLMVGYLCHAITSLLVAVADKHMIKGFILWQLGSFNGFSWDEVQIVIIVGLILLSGTYLLSKPLNALLLGEDYAKSMGVNIKLFRYLIVFFSSSLAGLVTAFAGLVAFIGIAAPHMARLLFGTTDNRQLIPGVMLLGAIVTSLCDLIARTAFSPVELPISAITSFFGAPIIIGLLLRKKSAI